MLAAARTDSVPAMNNRVAAALSLGGRCANPVTHSYTESDTPNTASGGATARSK